MANVTFLIGNGFDLQMGLKSRYTDFYKVYVRKESDDNQIQRFKETLLRDEQKGWVHWSDFESSIGERSVWFKRNGGVNGFKKCLNNFVMEFVTYLKEQCDNVDWDKTGKSKEIVLPFVESIICFREKVSKSKTKNHKDWIAGHIPYNKDQGDTFHFLQFNYTNIFDKLFFRGKEYLDNSVPNSVHRDMLLRAKLAGEALHIHGEMDQRPIMGVDNAEQIANLAIRNDEEAEMVFAKQSYLAALQDEQGNEPIPATKAISIIKDSDIICAFGTSIGKSDMHWWKVIGDWLRNEKKHLIVFDVCRGIDDGASPLGYADRKKAKKEKECGILSNLREFGAINDADFCEIKSRILIELDSPMFEFELPTKSTAKETGTH